jgi:hypothetical protein
VAHLKPHGGYWVRKEIVAALALIDISVNNGYTGLKKES